MLFSSGISQNFNYLHLFSTVVKLLKLIFLIVNICNIKTCRLRPSTPLYFLPYIPILCHIISLMWQTSTILLVYIFCPNLKIYSHIKSCCIIFIILTTKVNKIYIRLDCWIDRMSKDILCYQRRNLIACWSTLRMLVKIFIQKLDKKTIFTQENPLIVLVSFACSQTYNSYAIFKARWTAIVYLSYVFQLLIWSYEVRIDFCGMALRLRRQYI